MATNGRRLKGVLAALGLMLVSNLAVAQLGAVPWESLEESASYMSIEVGESDWTLYPVITVNSDFIGYFGYLPDEFVVGDNVSFLWLIPDNGDGTWSMYGWSNTGLKVVSDYLDNLTGTNNVLVDTGLDIFSGESQPIVDPKSMPFGIAEDDPSASIMEATQDPAIADALIAAGAAGAPNLTQATNLQLLDDCVALNAGSNFSLLDVQLALAARGVQDMMTVWLSEGILESIDATGFDEDFEFWCCPIVSWTSYGPWTAWVCTGGPSQGVSTCSYTGCTRHRASFRNTMWLNCTVISFQTGNQWQGPQGVQIPTLPGAACPSSP